MTEDLFRNSLLNEYDEIMGDEIEEEMDTDEEMGEGEGIDDGEEMDDNEE